MQFSGLYSLIPRLPLVLHEEEEGGHTSSAEIKLLLYGIFFYIPPSFPGSSKHLLYRIAGNFRGRKLLRITDFCGDSFRRLLAFAAPKEPHPKLFCYMVLSMYSLYATKEAQELGNRAGPCLREEEYAVSTSGFV